MFYKVLKYLTIGIVNIFLSAGEASSYLCLNTIYHPTSEEMVSIKSVLFLFLSIIIVFVLRLIALPILYNIKNSYFYDYLTKFGNDKKYMFKILLISIFMDIVLMPIQAFLFSLGYGLYWDDIKSIAIYTLLTGSSITAYLSFLIYIKIKMYYKSKKKLS